MIPTLCFRGILELAEIEVVMSLDRSLKSASSLSRHRNVLTRAERLEVLKDAEKWDDSKPVFGLPKVAHRKLAVGKAVKEEGTEEAGATPAAAAKGAAPAAAGAKGAAPAAGKGAAPAGAKGAAPAAKAAAPAAKKGK
jgi:small basic protein (TIGR04137 family)